MSNHEELKKLAAQLKQPSGAKGIEIGEMMNETNIKMTVHAIDQLNLLTNDKILELGHGNCGHLHYLFQQNKDLVYYGLEISELMNKEAQRINKDFIVNNQASFYLYNGLNIPFSDYYFDKIFTVNTLYFWKDVQAFLLEIYRVLKKGGMLNITFAQKSFMEQLPFTQFDFNLYDHSDIIQLIKLTPFEITNIETQIDIVKSRVGDLVDREFTTISICKS